MRLLILMLLACITLPVSAAPRIAPVQRDLNGDGKTETITLTQGRKANQCILTIGHASVTIESCFYEEVESCTVIDLNAHDGLREVLVTEFEPSDFANLFIYGFDGKTIVRVGELRFTHGVEFTGTGIVYARRFQDCFWHLTEKYVLNTKNRRLEVVKQPFYYVGVSGKVTRSLPIYETQQKKTVVANLSPNSTVEIVLNSGQWYLLKSKTGLLGWLPASEVTQENFPDLPWAN